METYSKQSYFSDVFDSYAKDIFRYIHVRVSKQHVAEDLTSEVFVKFWKKVLNEQSIQHERALLYTIAHGLVIDYYRKSNHEGVSLDSVDPIEFGAFDTTEQEIDTKEAITKLYNQLQKLKPDYQDILMLYYVEDIGITEIAEILQKQEGTVRVLIHRALEALKKLYD